MAVAVIGISGSPHRHGNTETLLDRFLDGTKNAGAGVEKVILKDLSYSACRGCNACHKTGNCIVQDEAIVLYEKMMAADCVAVASPIYTMGITAELKGLIDREQFLWARKFILKTMYFSDDHIKKHKGIFISTAGLGWEHVFDGAFPVITALFNTIGFEYYDNIIANDMDRFGGIKNHPTALADAYEKGQKVVKELEKLKQQ
jgi:multimeric flavodoxin WrbA